MLPTKCACCGHKYLIEGGEQEGINEDEIVVNLSCPNCGAEVYYVINGKCLNSKIEEERRMNKLSKQDIEELREFLTLGACEYSGTEEIVTDLVYETLQKFPTVCYYADEIGLTNGEEEFAGLDEFISEFWNKAIEKILNVVSTQ